MSLTHNIPEIGEFGSADRTPMKRQLAHVTVGPATTNDLVVTSTTTYVLFNVDEPIVVFSLYTQVTTPFTASVALDIGDSTNLERFSGSATIGATTSGAVLVSATGLTVPYAYAAAQDITIDVNGATAAVGVLDVYIEYALLSD
jgi:hypothetical protein